MLALGPEAVIQSDGLLRACPARTTSKLLLFVQDYLQFGSLARIVGGQLVTRPGDILAMTLFMRSAKAGQMFASEFMLLGLYAAMFRVARLVGPAHNWLLHPFPALLFRWQCLVSGPR